MKARAIRIELLLAAAMLFACGGIASSKIETAASKAVAFLPDNVGSIHASAPPADREIYYVFNRILPDEQSALAAAGREYRDAGGAPFWIQVVLTESDSGAYALLTQLASNQQPIFVGTVGTASLSDSTGIVFYKGNALVRIEKTGGTVTQEKMSEIGRAFAASLSAADDDIPALVKHLPSGQTSAHPFYALSLKSLQSAVSNQPVVDVIGFEGGTEVATANYGQSQLVIVEFTTPQFSIENDQRIWAEIAELKNKGQPTPTAYRRVGNYSVFVFNSPDEKTANALIDQVKYEQVVQWLGDDPHLYERMQKYFAETSAGVFIAVLKSSGLSLLLCLGAGGLIGTMMFRRRRSQKAAAYSDAGGSIRLNLDDLTTPVNTQRLLPTTKSTERNSANS